MRSSTSRQRGQAVIGMVIAVGLLALAMVGVLRLWKEAQIDSAAKRYGQTLSQFAIGARGFVAAVQSGDRTLPSNPYNVNGFAWLKAPSCGGLAGNPVDGFIPCAFDGGALAASYQTSVTFTPATSAVESRTNFFVPKSMVGDDGAGSLAASVANAALTQQLPVSGTFYTVYANSPTNALAPTPVASISPANRGRVLLIVNNAPSQDPWLRTDGTNKMLANLNAGGHSLVNAKDGAFSGDVSVTGDVSANKVSAKDGDFSNDVTAKGDVKAARARLTSTGDAAVNSSGHAFQIGPDGGANIIMDNNELMARNNGGTSPLYIQNDGGLTSFNGDVTVQKGLTVNPPSAGQNAADFNGNIKANDVYLSSIGRFASQSFYDLQVFTGATAYNVTKPNCSKVAHQPSTPQIFASMQQTGSATGGDALYNAQVIVYDYGSYWQVRPWVDRSSFSLTQTGSGTSIKVVLNKSTSAAWSSDGKVLVMTSCQ